jgi:hypothetical protein
VTAPVPLTAFVTGAKLRILDYQAADYDPPRYLSGIGARGTVSKAIDSSSLEFSANALEAVMADDATVLDDGFAVVELLIDGDWTEVGTPYMLAPGSGTVIGSAEGKAKEWNPVGTGALHGLLSECAVLPTDCDPDSSTILDFASVSVDGNVYVGWMSKGYTEDDTWVAATEHHPVDGDPKFHKPHGWPVEAAAAAWVNADDGDGGLTLAHWGSITAASRRMVQVGYTADEGGKVYVDGKNMGLALIDTSAKETGFKEFTAKEFLAEEGETYRISSEFTTKDSVGGDGFDACRYYVATLTDGGDIDEILILSSSDATVRRQSKSDVRPGMSMGETKRRMLQRNADLDIPAAQMLLDGRDFTDAKDSTGGGGDDGDDWNDGEEWSWPAFSTNLASAFADQSEDCDEFLASDFTYRCWNDRGGDKTATFDLVDSNAVLSYSWQGDPHGPTGYAVQSMEGWDLTFVTGAETGTRRRLGSFDSAASASIARARKNARAAVRQTGKVQREYQAVLAPVEGVLPGIDASLCDLVHGYGYRGLGLDLELVEWSWQQGLAVLYTVKLQVP